MRRSGRFHGIDPSVMASVNRHLQAREQQPQPPRPADRPLQLFLTSKTGTDDGGPATLRIYDAIGGWFGITASDVAELLDDIRDDRDLVVRINSPGGDVFDGTAVYNLLATRKGQVDVVVDGLAASAASFIAQAGDTITMNRGTQMMIHDAHGFTIGNAGDHRQMADLLDGVSDEIAGIYAARAGLTRMEWRDRMRTESWYNAEAAVEAGLADRTADADAEGGDAEEAAASWKRRVYASAHDRPAVAAQATEAPPAESAAGDPLDTVPDAELTSLGGLLAELFDETAGYDPGLLASTILDVYADAPAPPAPPPAPQRPRTTIPIDELIGAIQEGVAP